MKFACHFNPKNRRSIAVAYAMAKGAEACGHASQLVQGFEGRWGDVGVAYGWGHPETFERYRAAGGHFIYADLGWWTRKPSADLLGGYHKVSVDAREPIAYFRNRAYPADRLGPHGVTVAPWRQTGGHVLVAGMSEKSAQTRGWKAHQWECGMVDLLHSITGRPVVYRPKPSWPGARPIPGTIYSPPGQPLEAVLRDCWLAVSLHSNVAIDALVAGIPINVQDGVAAHFSTPMAYLETPRMPGGREQLLADISYAQWSIAEMTTGACLAHLLENSPLCA